MQLMERKHRINQGAIGLRSFLFFFHICYFLFKKMLREELDSMKAESRLNRTLDQ